MTISLSAETTKLVQDSMRDGGYKSADEVIRAGLESLKQRELLGEFDAGELDELLAEGERGGPSLDGEQVLAELRATSVNKSKERGMRLKIRPQARVDLLEIWHHIAADSREAANRVSTSLDEAIRGLLDMPGKGHTRADANIPGYRFWSVYSYVIAYRFDEKTLTVVRVVHGSRDFRRLFKR